MKVALVFQGSVRVIGYFTSSTVTGHDYMSCFFYDLASACCLLIWFQRVGTFLKVPDNDHSVFTPRGIKIRPKSRPIFKGNRSCMLLWFGLILCCEFDQCWLKKGWLKSLRLITRSVCGHGWQDSGCLKGEAAITAPSCSQFAGRSVNPTSGRS